MLRGHSREPELMLDTFNDDRCMALHAEQLHDQGPTIFFSSYVKGPDLESNQLVTW